VFLAKKVPRNSLLRHPLIFAALPQVHEAGITAVYLCAYPSPFFVPTDTPLLRQTLEQAIAATFDTDAQWYIAVARSPNVLGNLLSHVPGIAHCRVETPK